MVAKDKKTDVLFPKNLEDEVEKEGMELDEGIRKELVKDWNDITRVPPFERIKELKDNKIEPSEEYIHEFRVVEGDPRNRKSGRRGKPVKMVNQHLGIDFMLDFNA